MRLSARLANDSRRPEFKIGIVGGNGGVDILKNLYIYTAIKYSNSNFIALLKLFPKFNQLI